VFYEKDLGSTRFFAFSELDEIPGLLHAFTTRVTDTLVKDAGRSGEVAREKALFLSTLGISPTQVVQLKQVHSDRVLAIDGTGVSGSLRSLQSADAVYFAHPGLFAIIKTADCAPLIAVYPKGRAVCAVHAGWRGTRDRITKKALEQFLRANQAAPDDLIVAIGPCIGQCCYEVGVEVIEQFQNARHDLNRIVAGRNLDIVEANRIQLQELGIERILCSGMCTACRNDLFYSYRREGQTGRLWALVGFTA